MREYWTVEEAAVEWHADPATAKKWVVRGVVRGIVTDDGRLLIPLGEVARWQGVLRQKRGSD